MRRLHPGACRRSHPARRIDPGRYGGSFRSDPADRGFGEGTDQRTQRDYEDFRRAIRWRWALPTRRLNRLSRSRFRLAPGQVPRNAKKLITLASGPTLKCPLLAQSGHRAAELQCPLLGVKRTLLGGARITRLRKPPTVRNIPRSSVEGKSSPLARAHWCLWPPEPRRDEFDAAALREGVSRLSRNPHAAAPGVIGSGHRPPDPPRVCLNREACSKSDKPLVAFESSNALGRVSRAKRRRHMIFTVASISSSFTRPNRFCHDTNLNQSQQKMARHCCQ